MGIEVRLTGGSDSPNSQLFTGYMSFGKYLTTLRCVYSLEKWRREDGIYCIRLALLTPLPPPFSLLISP